MDKLASYLTPKIAAFKAQWRQNLARQGVAWGINKLANDPANDPYRGMQPMIAAGRLAAGYPALLLAAEQLAWPLGVLRSMTCADGSSARAMLSAERTPASNSASLV